MSKRKVEYIYSKIKPPFNKVEVKRKNIFGRLFCKHNYRWLVREEKNAIYHSPMGDEIEHICINCGKSKEIDFLYY